MIGNADEVVEGSIGPGKYAVVCIRSGRRAKFCIQKGQEASYLKSGTPPPRCK